MQTTDTERALRRLVARATTRVRRSGGRAPFAAPFVAPFVALVAVGMSPAQATQPAAAPLVAVLDAGELHAPVSKYEYGMFIEPIGGIIARTLWAEMLDDRKFYYPVQPASADAPVPPGVEGRPGFAYRKWRPIGGDGAVSMDGTDPYVGAHSPRVVLAGDMPRGLGQGGIALAKGVAYGGHLVARGDATADLAVALVWGDGAQDRQVVRLPAIDAQWRSLSFSFSPPVGVADARLEITGSGSGAFEVGVVSLMPADNIGGWRADTTRILRTLGSGMWRLPGGNFLSNWDWHGAIGPRDRRAPMFDHAWSAMQPNDLGMDEYMELTRLIGVEPYVTVNAGLGDANSAAEEVEYLNGGASTPWGARRAANGHPAPYGVKFWNIGNEPYGWWQIGKTSLQYFMVKHNEFASAMRAVDPSITLVGSGAMPDQMHPKDAKENATLDGIRGKFGTDDDWTGGLLANAWGNFDGLSEHWYDRAEARAGAPAADELLEFARSPSNQVRMKAEEWAIYQQRFPAMKDKHVFLAIDEYAYFGAPANLKLSLAYAMVLQEMLRHTDFITMGAFTMGVSTLDVSPTDAVLNSTGEVFKLYGSAFGAGTLPIAVTGDSPQPEPRFPMGFDHPVVRAGSPTYPLDVVAGLAADRRSLRIAVVNPTFGTRRLAVDLRGMRSRGAGRAWVLAGPGLDAANSVGHPPAVTVRESAVPALARGLDVPATSVAIYEFPVAGGR